jgi:hypothetical protein
MNNSYSADETQVATSELNAFTNLAISLGVRGRIAELELMWNLSSS